MFGLGSIGNFLPMIGSLGMGFSGGGLFSLGFTLLSGLLTNITSPANPGIDNFATHPGFTSASVNPGFGGVGGGPSAGTFGSMSGYFGSNYTSDYSILPQTQSGQYYNNANYCYGNQGVNYSPNAPVTYGQNYGYGQQMGNMQFGGNFSNYYNQYNASGYSQYSSYPSYQYGQMSSMYGSAPAPYQQGYQPVMSHYGFGNPQQYNPASTLYGQQSGSVQVSYGRPTYGGPQNGQPTVINNHYDIHIHNDGTANNCPPPPTEENCPAPPVQPQPAPAPAPPEHCEPQPQPPVSNYPQPQPMPTEDCPPDVSPVTGNQTVDRPAEIVSTNSTAASTVIQTQWSRTPHINTDSDWAAASKSVADRITGGDSSSYSFGGRNIYQNADGMMPERSAVWHVFQQNENLRLDLKSGYFYETKPDGSTLNRFSLSQVADLERQCGDNHSLGSQLVGGFLFDRSLAASGVSPAPTNVSYRGDDSGQVTQESALYGKGRRSFG